MDIDFSPLVRTIEWLEEAIAAYRRDTSQTLIRDGLVQRFEFTYEISHKRLHHYLAAHPGPPDASPTLTSPSSPTRPCRSTSAEDFSGSGLPFRVDILDWATASEAFRRHVEQDKVVIQSAGRQ